MRYMLYIGGKAKTMYRILLVDDEILVRDAIKENIDWKSMDCELVGDCENGKQAADFVKNHPVDIVLTDILMPYMDGMELSHFLHDNFPEIVIVALGLVQKTKTSKLR